ncbi:unnamed protein product, partial [Brenthis ino]
MFKLVVLSAILASAACKPSGVASLWGGHLAAPWAAAVAAPLAAHVAAPIAAAPLAPVGAYNYRGPLSLAPGQPANILAHDGRPLDTLSVNVDRAVHYTAKALDPAAHGWHGAHLLGKRSVVAPWAVAPAAAWAHSARIDIPAHVVAPAALAVTAPVAHLGLAHGAILGHGHW